MNVLPPDDELGRRLVHGQLQKKALRSAKDKIKDVILSKNCNPIIVRLAVGAPIHACSLGFYGCPSPFSAAMQMPGAARDATSSACFNRGRLLHRLATHKFHFPKKGWKLVSTAFTATQKLAIDLQ